MGPKLEPVGRTEVIWQGETYTFFGGNDYHRFSSDPDTLQAFIEATARWGINSAGSRMTTANHPVYEHLENKLSAFLGVEAAAIFSAGYMSNAVLLQAIKEDYTHLLLDEIAHSSLVEAAQLVQLPMIRFRHCDADSLRSEISKLPPNSKPLILTDGTFASSGAIPTLDEYAATGVKILIDDAHATGVLGPTGRGSWQHHQLERDQVYLTGTFSKGLGGFGGWVAGDKQTIERIHKQAPSFTGSTPPPIPVVAAAIASIGKLQQNYSMIHLIQKRSDTFKTKLREMGFTTTSHGPAPICSATFLNEQRNQELAEALKQNRIYPVFINYPGCPPGGHFRFTMSSAHSEEQVNRLVGTIQSCL